MYGTVMDFRSTKGPSIGAVFPGRNVTSSLSFHENGERLFIASAQDHQLQIVDAVNGTILQQPLHCEREQLQFVEATHHDQCVLFAGRGTSGGRSVNNGSSSSSNASVVHYWSLYDNKILRQFKGHSGAVTSMHMCPADDTFLTCSNDRTVRLWNIQQAGGVAELKLVHEKEETEGTPMAQYDSTGLVIAISTMMKSQAGHHLHMYDARNYQAGAFAELKVLRTDVENAIAQHANVAMIPPANLAGLGPCVWKSLQFNKGGDRLLVRAEKGLTLLLDGFDGTVQKAFCTGRPTARDAVACFASDDKTILQGYDDGSITCWDIDTGMNIRTLSGHIGPVSCLASNPKYTQLASSCSQTALWIW